MINEIPIRFDAAGGSRIGILHLPAPPAKRGVLIIVGGWQYRAGSHRQFVLLGRALAIAGIAVMRFDSRGMGDSDGEPGFPEPAEHLAPDLRAALDAFAAHTGIGEFVLCGLCDGASAALMYAAGDPRVSGLILLNPWIGSAEAAARATLRHYYFRRLFAPELWRKASAGRLDLRRAAQALVATIRTARNRMDDGGEAQGTDPSVAAGRRIDRAMADGLDKFAGPILLVLSGRDLTAARYSELVTRSARWQALLRSGRAARVAMPSADHTFSSRALRDVLAGEASVWLRSW
jgi:exosortase A-associated hydrolase 1